MYSGGIPTHHIYENHPLDKPILQYLTCQFRDWQLSDNYGDNALFRLQDGKLIFAGSPTDNNFRHFDFEAPSDRGRNNIYELEFFITETNGARVTKNTTDTPLNDIPLTGTPLQYHVHLEASGDGPSPTPLTLQILTYRLTREGGGVGNEISIDHQAQSVSFKWYLRVGEENMVVRRDVVFTPHEPGHCGLELTLNGVVGYARWTYVTWWEGVSRVREGTDEDDLIEFGPSDSQDGLGHRGGKGNDYINADEASTYIWANSR